MPRSACVTLLLLSASAAAPAQADGWVPPTHARRGGNDGFGMPGNYTTGRLQQIHDQADLPAGFTPPKLLTKIAYRRSCFQTTASTTFAGKSLMVEVSAGNSTIPGSAMTSTYASNQPGDLSIVLPLGNVNLPSSPPFGAFQEVGPDNMIFPFLTPKIFTGPHLFIEIVNNMPPYVSTAYWSDSLDNGTARTFGHNTVRGEFGCGTVAIPTNLRAASAISNNQLGTSTGYTLAAATVNTGFLFTIGFQLDTPYGLPAPFDLVPLGAPLCPLWNSMEVISIGATTASGTASVSVSWPADQSIAGLQVGMQALVISPGFNAAGLTTSNGVSAWIGARYPLASSCVFGNSLTNLTGTLFLRGTPITHLYWF